MNNIYNGFKSVKALSLNNPHGLESSNGKTLKIKYLSCEQKGILLNLKFEVEAKYLKEKKALLNVIRTDVSTNALSSESVTKLVEINPNDKRNVEITVPLSFANNESYKTNKYFRTSVNVDGIFALSEGFVIKVKTIYSSNDRKDIKELLPTTKIKEFIKEFESLKTIIKNKDGGIDKIIPYNSLEGGNKTIGWGHKLENKENFDGGISLAEAEKIFENDIKTKGYEKLLNYKGDMKISVKLAQNEFDAIVSAVFNNGYGDTLGKMVNKGSEYWKKYPKEVYMAFLTRRYVGTSEFDGLIKRRACEAEIFMKNKYEFYGKGMKYETEKDYISAWKTFLKTGVLPIIIMILTFISCKKLSQKEQPEYKETFKQNFEYIEAKKRILKEDCVAMYGLENANYSECYQKEKMRWDREILKIENEIINILDKKNSKLVKDFLKYEKEWHSNLDKKRDFVANFYLTYSGGNRSDLDIMIYFRNEYDEHLKELYNFKEYDNDSEK